MRGLKTPASLRVGFFRSFPGLGIQTWATRDYFFGVSMS